MSSNDGAPTVSVVITSLSQSLARVPPAAVPAALDCILTSTSLSPSSLFASLLDTFPNISNDNLSNKDEKLDADQFNNLTSLVGALCHLLKRIGAEPDALESFIRRCLIPFIKLIPASDRELLNQISESFISLVLETNAWSVVEATLVLFSLRSAVLSMNIAHEEINNFGWDWRSVSMGSKDMLDSREVDRRLTTTASGFFSLPVSCYILTVIMDAALHKEQLLHTSKSVLTKSSPGAESFIRKLIYDLCNLSERLLLLSFDHRSCAINFLLPVILKTFSLHCHVEVSINGQTRILSRKSFFIKMWKCCRTLFSFGPSERRDAYSILSLYLCFFPYNGEREDVDICNTRDIFDISAEKDFWDQIKRGLVDKESIVRKQSLNILKKMLPINEESEISDVSQTMSRGKNVIARGVTKREQWADKEAKSLGVGKICGQIGLVTTTQKQWEAFVLLYEMLDEYGTHLIEAAWNHQVNLLLQMFKSAISVSGTHQNHVETSREIFSWLSILWERGFQHDNPLVRCLIMQSFLAIEWENYAHCTRSLPETFVLGPFIQALNDPVHHKDFGAKGVYSSKTIEGAARFFHQYTSYLDTRKQTTFLLNLASILRKQSFGRAGLMCLAECIASVASKVLLHIDIEAECFEDATLDTVQAESTAESYSQYHETDLLDTLRFVVESSKQHFNPKYRVRVCEKILDAAASVLCAYDAPLGILLNFISSLPREFTDYGGSLRVKVQRWLLGHGKKESTRKCCIDEMEFLKGLHNFPKSFMSRSDFNDTSVTYDDEELEAWESDAKRWARVLFLAVKEEQHLTPILTFIQNCGADICKQKINLEWISMKFLILIISLIQEIQLSRGKAAEVGVAGGNLSELDRFETDDPCTCTEAAISFEKFANSFLFVLEELLSYASMCCSIFWSDVVVDTTLPSSVKGKLGGPSQRRLPCSIASSVLLAITSMKAVASILSQFGQLQTTESLNHALIFLWRFFLKIISPMTCRSEISAEISLAAYEALCPVLRVVASMFSPQLLVFTRKELTCLQTTVEGKPLLDSLVTTFLDHINSLLAAGVLARTRRAVLLKWKWLCLESLLSIPYHTLPEGCALVDGVSSFSKATLRCIFNDLVENLENAGEGSVLPMLRLVRLVVGLLSRVKFGVLDSSCDGVDAEMMWHLVQPSWILHVSCNKRRVAHIAALLSSVLHSSVFSNKTMHLYDNAQGPLKWFVEKVLEEGTKSPRTFRLVALHLSGMWMSYPWTIKYYIKELKLLSLYGSVAFDEDFEAELADFDTRNEVSLLAKSPDPELSEVFINTELYARVSVAVLFDKLADLADLVGSIDEGSRNESQDCHAALESGKLFLLELLHSAVNDNDLSKELYKKYSAIHRRKIRAWQMICVLSRFVDKDIILEVTESLHISLQRNNLPAVRQYLETFAINIYLKFPSLVAEQLVPILRDYDMRPQALSSYVFIAANIILNATEVVQYRHLHELLPPIVPQLTSHHHSLRGFTQLLVYQVLCKVLRSLEPRASDDMPLEKRCFDDLKSYLEKNQDCVRLRASMEGYLDAYNPNRCATPAGIFISRVEVLEFECVPTSLMEQVLTFLNEIREDLRSSMENDIVTIKNECFKTSEDSSSMGISSDVNKEKVVGQLLQETSLDFQKKITLNKHDKQDTCHNTYLGGNEAYKHLLAMEKDDELLHQLLLSRSQSMEGVRPSRQNFFLVASLLDRIPNLAGLARTCEVFKAAGLAIADKDILHDKQFQLISVTADKWVPIIEVPVNSVKVFLEKKKREGFSILGLEQTANSVPLDQYIFPKRTVLVLGREKEGIPVDIIHVLDACVEIPQLGVVRSLNVHVSGAIALWEYTRQQRCQ